jgi:5-methylcytosine-specific restriction endonuclease McrA
MKEWRQAVFKRDNFTCQDCGVKGYLQAHHLVPISRDLDKAFSIENGRTVCVECHEKIHGRFIGKFKQKA